MKTEQVETTVEVAGKHWEVDVMNIKPLERTGGNLRIDYGEEDGSFKELIDSIRENGIRRWFNKGDK